MGKINRLYHTVVRLSLIQIVYRMKYTLKRKLIEKHGASVYQKLEKKYAGKRIQVHKNPMFLLNNRKHYPDNIENLLVNKIKFLNDEIDFGEKIDWHKDELNRGTRLWKLNLNYHEFLIDIAYLYKETGNEKYLNYLQETISEWFVQNPLGTKGYGQDNWNSYAISLRLISWIKIYESIGDQFVQEFHDFFVKLLWIQSEFLRTNLEYDILGNHLIKNWKALHWCKSFFQTDEYDTDIRTLDTYVFEQFTKDQFHEELSPMYSAIVLEDLLEVFAVFPDSLDETLLHKLLQNIQWLTFANDYAFFNDSVTRNGVQLIDLTAFYGKIFPDKKMESIEGYFNVDGYIGYKNDQQHLIIDFAKVVEGKQPGHLQCDALSFEFALNNEKVLTNSGTYEYNYGERRHYSRSTESHNTLKYGSFDQSQIWGSFRVAKQAQTSFEIIELTDDKVHAVGEVRGFDFNRNTIHKREFLCQKSYLQIKDIMYSKDQEHASCIFYHLTPEFTIKNNQILSKKTNTFVGEISCNMDWEVEITEFYKEFGRSQEKDTIVIKSVPSHTEVVFEIEFNE